MTASRTAEPVCAAQQELSAIGAADAPLVTVPITLGAPALREVEVAGIVDGVLFGEELSRAAFSAFSPGRRFRSACNESWESKAAAHDVQLVPGAANLLDEELWQPVSQTLA